MCFNVLFYLPVVDCFITRKNFGDGDGDRYGELDDGQDIFTIGKYCLLILPKYFSI